MPDYTERAADARALARVHAVEQWRRGFEELCSSDPDLAAIVDEAGPPLLELRDQGFAGLLRAIVAQQVSTASARAIWTRVNDQVQPLTAAAFLNASEEEIRACGFSRQKISYGRGLADAIVRGTLDLERLATRSDEDALSELVAHKGIGRWSGEVYLLFAEGRPDIFPAQDLALAVAAQRVKRLPERPKPADLRELATLWRPWRSVAAILLWHYYRTAP